MVGHHLFSYHDIYRPRAGDCMTGQLQGMPGPRTAPAMCSPPPWWSIIIILIMIKKIITFMIIMNTIIVTSIINLMTTLSSQPLVPVLLRLRSPSMRSTVWPWQKKIWSWTVKDLFGVFWSDIDVQKLTIQKSKTQSKKHIRTIVYLICYKAPDTLATSKVKLRIPGVRWVLCLTSSGTLRWNWENNLL